MEQQISEKEKSRAGQGRPEEAGARQEAYTSLSDSSTSGPTEGAKRTKQPHSSENQKHITES